MSEHLPILIVLCPLVGALVVPLVARVSTSASRALTVLATLSSLACALAALRAVLVGDEYHGFNR